MWLRSDVNQPLLMLVGHKFSGCSGVTLELDDFFGARPLIYSQPPASGEGDQIILDVPLDREDDFHGPAMQPALHSFVRGSKQPQFNATVDQGGLKQCSPDYQ